MRRAKGHFDRVPLHGLDLRCAEITGIAANAPLVLRRLADTPKGVL